MRGRRGRPIRIRGVSEKALRDTLARAFVELGEAVKLPHDIDQWLQEEDPELLDALVRARDPAARERLYRRLNPFRPNAKTKQARAERSKRSRLEWLGRRIRPVPVGAWNLRMPKRARRVLLIYYAIGVGDIVGAAVLVVLAIVSPPWPYPPPFWLEMALGCAPALSLLWIIGVNERRDWRIENEPILVFPVAQPRPDDVPKGLRPHPKSMGSNK